LLGHDKLVNYYQTNFNLMHHHKYSLSDLENMIPWERHVYIDLLREHLKQEEERLRDQAAAQKRKR
jgi:hypothetical protein